MRLSLLLLASLFFLQGCSEQSQSTDNFEKTDEVESEIKHLMPKDDAQKLKSLERLINLRMFPCKIEKLDSVLVIKIAAPPIEWSVPERNNLIVDSILILTGNNLWPYPRVDFHLTADTSNRSDAKYFHEMYSSDTSSSFVSYAYDVTVICIVKRHMIQENLMALSKRINSVLKRDLIRLLLNECTVEELRDFQTAMDLMNFLRPDDFPDRFIPLVMTLGEKADTKDNNAKELRTIEKMVDLSEILKEQNVYLNVSKLKRILELVDH